MADASWSKNGPVLSTAGPVVIGKSEPRAALTVDGDIYTSGRVVCPSDIRLKDNITEKEAKEALENLQKLRIVDYFYKPEVAEKWGMPEEQRKRTGVIAQELAAIIPDAVRDLGDYLTVNESRVFYETVLATQELCRLTGDLDQKIDEKVAEISRRLAEYAQKKKMLSSVGSNLNSEGRSLNTSRTSLDSSSTAVTITNTKRNRRNRKKAQRQPPKSKMTHGTIMGLVGTMAFCLLAMSALYILDWHNRNYGYHHASPSSTTSGPKEGPGNIVIPLDHYTPFSQPDAPPLALCPLNNCRAVCCEAYDKEHDGMPQFDYDSSQMEDGDYSYKPEARSDFHMKGFGNDVKIFLPDFGVYIDERYCIEKSCSKKRNMFNLFIPMTRWMPASELEIEIEAPISMSINSCGFIEEFDNMKCGEVGDTVTHTDTPTARRVIDKKFRLSVGQWSQSAYRFRVGLSTELCNIPEGTFGGFYQEYNLVFYRVCKKTNGTAIEN
ncbi:unnamed protein product [Caenorhabditis sp. 36 PRJEB53466]|nr:unnamed protein product [Caenorhabditis sp. 36 PRJEB53466]